MNPLLNPNVAYVLLVLGFITGILALFSPGTGLLEIGAVFALLLAAYSIIYLPFNAWAIGVLVVGFIPFFFSLRARNARMRWLLLIVALAAYIVGSVFLFTDANGRPAVNLGLVLILSSFSIVLAWMLTRKSIEAIVEQPIFDLDRLVGMIGKTSSDLTPFGSVYVNGEEWTARSDTFVPTGSQVRIIGRNELTLEVIAEPGREETTSTPDQP